MSPGEVVVKPLYWVGGVLGGSMPSLGLFAGSLAMSNGGGLLRVSAEVLKFDDVEPTLEADRLRLWPLPWLPVLLIVLVRGRPAGRTLSVRIWRWKRVPVAASESVGISSLR